MKECSTDNTKDVIKKIKACMSIIFWNILKTCSKLKLRACLRVKSNRIVTCSWSDAPLSFKRKQNIFANNLVILSYAAVAIWKSLTLAQVCWL